MTTAYVNNCIGAGGVLRDGLWQASWLDCCRPFHSYLNQQRFFNCTENYTPLIIAKSLTAAQDHGSIILINHALSRVLAIIVRDLETKLEGLVVTLPYSTMYKSFVRY